MSVAPWTLRDSESDLSRLTAAQDFEGHALSHGAAFQRELDIVGILHLPAAESDQDIADDLEIYVAVRRGEGCRGTRLGTRRDVPGGVGYRRYPAPPGRRERPGYRRRS